MYVYGTHGCPRETTGMPIITKDAEAAFWCFAKKLLDDAYRDSPAELHEWCSSTLCKELCIHFQYDRNEYRKRSMTKCLAARKLVPMVAYAGPKADPKDTWIGPLFTQGL